MGGHDRRWRRYFPRKPLTEVRRGDERGLTDVYPAAFWAFGKKGTLGAFPRLAVLSQPPAEADPKYHERYAVTRVHEIPWAEFWSWMEAGELRLVRDSRNVYLVRSQRRVTLPSGEAARRARWEVEDPV